MITFKKFHYNLRRIHFVYILYPLRRDPERTLNETDDEEQTVEDSFFSYKKKEKNKTKVTIIIQSHHRLLLCSLISSHSYSIAEH